MPNYIRPLRCDLFDETANALIEAKSSVSRESVRLAIGQLFDYRRFEQHSPELSVLMPRRPTDDLFALLGSTGIHAIWQTEVGFEEQRAV